MADRIDSRITNAPVGATLTRPVAPTWMPGLTDFLPDWQGVRRQSAQSAAEVNADVAAGNYGRAAGSMLRGSAATGGAMATAVLDPAATALRNTAYGVADFVRGIVGAPAGGTPAPAVAAPAPAAPATLAAANAVRAAPEDVPAPAVTAAATAVPRMGLNGPQWDMVRGVPLRLAAPIVQGRETALAGRTAGRGSTGADIARTNGVQIALRRLAALDAAREGMAPAARTSAEDDILRTLIALSGGNSANDVLGDIMARGQ